MVSQKARMILASKTDLGDSEISALSEEEAWARIYALREVKTKDNRLEVCISGFGASKKAELAASCSASGIKVVGSVTRRLDFLCVGGTPGPAKLKQAHEQGVQLLTEDQLAALIRTGEFPREV